MADGTSFHFDRRRPNPWTRLENRMPAFLAVPLLTGLAWLWTCVFAVPVWLLWTDCGLGTRYFTFLPVTWQSVPLMHVVGLFLLIAIMRTAMSPMKFTVKARSPAQ